MKIIRKNDLIDGKFYIGYVNQNISLLTGNEQMVVAKWDEKNGYFIYENDVILYYLKDVEDEIKDGFLPTKEINF